MKSPLKILKEYWGYSLFRPKQEEIIHSILGGVDTVALLPTGGGKSICFQVPALINKGICVVVTPLVALMSDQVKSLKDKGIKAISIQGGITFQELSSLLENAVYGNYKFIYLSPERLQQELVQNAIKRMDVNLIAVDEAHCISQWGNDFRPAYKNIHLIRQLHPNIPVVALTATATKQVLSDTIEQLKLKKPNVATSSFFRNNISYQVKKVSDKYYYMQQLLKGNLGSAIVYVRNRKKSESISNHLNHIGITSTFYHGGITPTEKNERLQIWKNQQISTIVATNAFGMGIDHPTVRYVIHIQLPESLESYFQEAGRAGRDGEKATAIILYNEEDKQSAYNQFVAAQPSAKDIKKIYRTLNNYFQISYGEGQFTNHSFNFNDFCNTYHLNTLVTYNTLTILDRLGIIKLSKEFGRKSLLRFMVSSVLLLKEFENNLSFSIIGKTILRMYGGIFESENAINLNTISQKTGISIHKVILTLEEMESQGLLELKLHNTDASITFILPREDDKTINPRNREIKAIKVKKESQLNFVIDYIENTSICRSNQLVGYFGEITDKACGTCEICKKEKIADSNSIHRVSEKIRLLIKETPLSSREIVEKLSFSEEEIIESLVQMLDAKKIKLDIQNRYHI